MQYTTTLGSNPFGVLTSVVAPAILTNACSVLALGTSNRLARVVDRTRVVAGELDAELAHLLAAVVGTVDLLGQAVMLAKHLSLLKERRRRRQWLPGG